MDRLEHHLRAFWERCDAVPDKRTGGNGHDAMADFGVAAFSVFFMQSPSFLAHQRALAKGRGRGLCNLHTLFGLTKVPCDIHIGDMLDGAPTAPFDAVFLGLARDLDKAGGLRPFRRLGGAC